MPEPTHARTGPHPQNQSSRVRRRTTRVAALVAVAVVVLALAGCGSGDDAGENTSSGGGEDTSSAELGSAATKGDLKPASTATLPARIKTWERNNTDESAGEASGNYLDSDTGQGILATVIDFDAHAAEVGFTPDEVPRIYQDWEDSEELDSGWSCGTVTDEDSPTCYRMLDGGRIDVTCGEEDCAGTTHEILADLGTLLYDQFPAAGADIGDGGGDGGLEADDDLCAGLDLDAITDAVGDQLGEGEITVDTETSEAYDGTYHCALTLPPSSFTGGDGVTQDTGTGTDAGSLVFYRYTYEEGYSSDHGVSDVDCSIGGSSPQEVFDSASSCTYDITEAQTGASDEVISEPDDAGGGLVIDGQIEFTLATPGDYWWEGSLSGITGSSEFVTQLRALAQLVGESEASTS